MTSGLTTRRIWERTRRMAYAQGSLILAPATFKSGVRPYLVVSNRTRPFF
ncbi:PemK/MazF family toxin [Halapricum desulfuricans]|uniref:PemK/MazF family toxin n=1 Tax=Halapricum desulfuricans TaxID=2841257 RepID=A0A897N5F0_9EURY|nr:PemK/MazF family toxin [Halapricum desulfuricans]